MAKLTDIQIKAWIKNDERFEGKSDGDGLYLSFRKDMAVSVWRLRYKFKGIQRWVTLGSYADLSLADARKQAKELRARVALGYDVAAEKQERKAEARAKIEAEAVELLRDIIRLSDGVNLFPARKYQEQRLPYVHENTLNVALSNVKANMPDVEPFTIHDFRRTARTNLAALGIESHIAERCLNHKIKGVEGIYNRHDYFDERKFALQKLANFLETCEKGTAWNVTPIRRAV